MAYSSMIATDILAALIQVLAGLAAVDGSFEAE
jgi:hypothetical protein